MKKTLIVSCIFPPMVAGPTVLLGNLLRYFPKGSFCVLMGDLEKVRMPLDYETTLDCKCFFCSVPPRRGKSVGSFLSYVLEFLLIPITLMKGLKILKSEKIDNILTTTYSSFEIVAYFLHRIKKISLYLYLFDAYEESQVERLKKFITKFFEKRLFFSATKIFVMSENLQKHYLEKYGITTELIPHPVDLSLYNNQREESYANNRKSREPYKIVFTGMIYGAQLDALKNLVSAVNSLVEKNVKLILYTPVSTRDLVNMGIYGINVESRFAKRFEIPYIQKNADILFLPLAFNSPYPDVIRTASPSKLPEYLAAGKPILVHAPKYSYIANYARKNGFALVVDELNPMKLKQAISLLIDDKDLRSKLVLNAKRTVKNHDATKISNRLQKYLLE